MLIKFITRSLRPLGMILIFLFATACIFGSMVVRDIEWPFLNHAVHYTVSFENRFYDFRMKDHLKSFKESKEIVFVKIDDYSLQKMGVWPIPRTHYATMIDKLGVFGAKVAALDILFPEKSPILEKADPDKAMAASIKNFQTNGRRIFISYSIFDEGDPEGEALSEVPVEMLNDVVDTRTDGQLHPQKINRYSFPIPDLLETEVGLGFISMREDLDGTFRRYKLLANIDTIYYGSLGLNAYDAYMGTKDPIKVFKDSSAELEIDGRKLEIDPHGETKIRYAGEDIFPSVSLYDVITAPDNDQKMQELFKNKMVFVGSTALGAHDLRPSPINSKMPGVYAHINMAHMLLHKFFYAPSDGSVQYSLIILVLGMLIFLMVQRMGHAFLDTAVIGLIMAMAYYVDQIYFLPQGYELKLFYCFFCFTASYSWNTFLKFYEANKEKKQIKGTFARYVAPTIVDEMLKDPDKLHVGGTKMDITCLFSDVRDFTKISEGLSATELAHSLNIYMGAMTDIVFETKGTLDKYIGDAIVALWGAPLEIGNHAQYAVEGAIRMMETLPAINEKFRELGRPEFNVGIGLNSGECSVGNMGSERIFSYTALGDNMNLGARLESLCKYYGAQILISDMTLERLDLSKIKTRPIDKVVVKGKTLPVGIHEVLHSHHWLMKDEVRLNQYLKGYELFKKKEFSAALELFNDILKLNEQDKPSRRLRDICKGFIEDPNSITENFEITVMTEK